MTGRGERFHPRAHLKTVKVRLRDGGVGLFQVSVLENAGSQTSALGEKRSPRGLLTNTTIPGRLQPTGRPGEYALKELDPAHFIAFWRNFVGYLIEASRKEELRRRQQRRHAVSTDGGLNFVDVAGEALARIDRIESLLASDAPLHDLAVEMFQFATDIHQMTVLENETGIDAQRLSLKGSHDARSSPKAKARANKIQARNVSMAREFLRRRAEGSGKRPSALKAEIGAKMESLSRRQAIDAIDVGLKILCGDRGKPHK